MTIRTVLCVSTLQIDATAAGKLFRETRAVGDSTCTQGAIVSDGDRVAHMLHGAPERISVMLNQILSDERLRNVKTSIIRDCAHDDGTWLLAGWKTGWATPELLDAILIEPTQASDNPLKPYMQALLQCDLL